MGELIAVFVTMLVLKDDQIFSYKNIFGSAWKYVCAGSVMGLVIMVVGKILDETVMSLCVLVILGGITYILLLCALRETYIWGYLDIIKTKIYKRRKK